VTDFMYCLSILSDGVKSLEQPVPGQYSNCIPPKCKSGGLSPWKPTRQVMLQSCKIATVIVRKTSILFVRRPVLHKVAYSLYDLNLTTPATEISGWVSSDTHKRAVLMTAISMRSSERMNATSSQRADMFQINIIEFLNR
jgi:hypothetical protein